ncbi:MAG: phenylalanine--tRNA ligase subunit alpha [Candidatus Acidiferrum sp.]
MQIENEIRKLDDLTGVELQKTIAQLADKVRQSVGEARTVNEEREFFDGLFASEGGLFWRIYAKVLEKSGRVSWADYGTRQFLITPIERFLDLSFLGDDPEYGVRSLELYFDALLRGATDMDKFDLARSLWENRAEGIKSRAGDWLKVDKPHLKRVFGRRYNELRAHVESQIESRRQAIESGADQTALAHERVDLSLPGVQRPIGSHHLIRQVFQQIEDIFVSIGFSVVEGPEIETPYYNFEALNIPEFHPVRDDMDTFYIDLPKGAPTPLLLRTHTSPMQIRTMEKRKPPVRVIVPGKVYRRDNPDATHSFIFHQVEGLAVDTDITFCDFTGTIEYFVKQFFGPGVKTRFRPSYFPFTEPSVEFDVSCIFCGGSGTSAGGGTCSKCKGAGWIELFGAGMVDPAVYGFVNYDAKKVSGFAFGMGIDRLAMLKYQIDDIQVFFQNDVRFLRQFP